MSHQRVLVTGVGLVSSLATDAPRHFERLLRGESGVRIATDPRYNDHAARLEARIANFDRSQSINNRMLRKLLSPASSYAVAAAGEAVQDADLAANEERLRNCGLYVGSIAIDINPEVFIPAFGASLDQQGEFEMSRFAKRGVKLLDPLFLVKALPNAGICGISIQHQILGANINITNGAVSGLQAVTMAAAAIRRGEIELAVAGGYDSLLRMDSIAEYLIAGRLASQYSGNDTQYPGNGAGEPGRACRPFDMERQGFVVGEGAAFVVLESEAHARERKAAVYAEILGAGQTTDGTIFGRTDSDAGSREIGLALEHAARQALRQGSCAPEEVGGIFGDGLATATDDLREGAVVRRLVQETPVPFTAATAAVGFTGAASGAFSLIHAMLAMRQQVMPALINCWQPDPRCAVTFFEQAQEIDLQRALVWNSDHGVKNVALLMGTY